MQALSKVVEEGMITDVTIVNHTTADNPFSDDEYVQETVSQRQTVKGWLREVPAGTIDVVSGVMASVGIYRLFLPIGTQIQNGDRVIVNNEQYVVEDTNDDTSYQVTLKVSLKRAE